MRSARFLGIASSLAIAGTSHAVVMNFDSTPSGTIADTFFAGVTFSSEAGYNTAVYAYTGPSPISAPNVLTPYFTQFNIPQSVPDLYVDFSTPVNNLSFLAVAADEFGVVARVNVYTTGNVLLGTDNIIGTAGTPSTFGFGSTLVNLSAYSNVTRIEVVPPIGQFDLDNSYGGGGLAYDNLSFDPVPGPSVVALGAAWVVCGLRRRRVAM